MTHLTDTRTPLFRSSLISEQDDGSARGRPNARPPGRREGGPCPGEPEPLVPLAEEHVLGGAEAALAVAGGAPAGAPPEGLLGQEPLPRADTFSDRPLTPRALDVVSFGGLQR
ncbi:hypothetical protein GCM10010299_56290 [Streptomyces tanashiensis]|nr:hypothetical protein GCM10010299_56290 [Streptomyces tanashiensis]